MFRSVYALLAIAALLPLVISAGLNLSLSLRTQRELMERSLRLDVAEISGDLDQELRSLFAIARIIADLPVFDSPNVNFDSLDEWLPRVMHDQPLWQSLKIFDLSGRAVYLHGTTVAVADEPASLQRTITELRPTLGALVKGPDGIWTVPVRAPVVRNGTVLYVVTIVVSAEMLSNFLAQVKTQPGAITAIVDGTGTIVARSVNAANRIGYVSPGSNLVRRRSETSGTYTVTNLDGIPVVGAYHRSTVSDWSVHTAISKDVFDRPYRDLLTTVVGVIVVAIVLAIFFVCLMLRGIRQRQHEITVLAQKNRMESLGRLTGRVAHDFNNLLTIIRANLELLEQRPSSRSLAAIRTATENAAALVRDLLDFSQGRAAAPVLVDLNARIRHAVATMETRLRQITILFDLADTALVICVDPVQLDMTLINLITNAFDAMPNGGELRISTELRREGGKHVVCLCIRDTGHGIPKTLLPRLFEPFFTTKEPGKGTGLGLAQVYSFVTSAGGTIEVNSSKNGTEFTLRFVAAGESPRTERFAVM